MISGEDVRTLAELALIDISEEESATLAREVDAILGYVSEIQNASQGESSSAEKNDHRNVLREDVVEVCAGEYSADILEQFPEKIKDRLAVPKIL